MRKHLGFTLAEVLITLGIIGVVAAMTIPTLMSNTGKSEMKSGFKKVISALNQAVTMSVAVDYTDFSDTTGTGVADNSIYSLLSSRMQVTSVGGRDSVANTNASTMGVTSGNYTLFFSDGMALSYSSTAKGCTTKSPCKALIDVNGAKKPNKLANCQINISGGTISNTATSDNSIADSGTTCTENNAYIADQYSVVLRGQLVVPNGHAARYVLYDN